MLKHYLNIFTSLTSMVYKCVIRGVFSFLYNESESKT